MHCTCLTCPVSITNTFNDLQFSAAPQSNSPCPTVCVHDWRNTTSLHRRCPSWSDCLPSLCEEPATKGRHPDSESAVVWIHKGQQSAWLHIERQDEPPPDRQDDCPDDTRGPHAVVVPSSGRCGLTAGRSMAVNGRSIQHTFGSNCCLSSARSSWRVTHRTVKWGHSKCQQCLSL